MPVSVEVKQFVVKKIDFVNDSITGSFTTKESTTFTNISSGCAESVTKKIASCGCDCINVPDATEILEHLHESHLLTDDKEKIVHAINGKTIKANDTTVQNDGQKNATNTQTIPIEKYLMQRAWDFILSDATHAARLSFLGDLCRVLGVFNPSEKTAGEIASLAFIGQRINPSDVVYVRELKVWLKDKVRNAPFIKGPNVYPDNPEKLKETHPQIWDIIYKDQRPVECPLNPSTIKAHMAEMPLRCTRFGSRTSKHERRRKTPVLSSEIDAISSIASVLERGTETHNRECPGLGHGENQEQARVASVSPTIDMPPPPKPLLQNEKNGVDDMTSQMKTQISKTTSVTDADETKSEDGNGSDGKKVKKRPASARLARSDIKKTKAKHEVTPEHMLPMALRGFKKTEAKYKVTPEHMLPMALRGFKKTKATTKKKAGRMEETVRMQGHIDSKLNNRYAPAPVKINSNNFPTLR